MVSKYLINVTIEEVVSDLKRIRVDMLEHEKHIVRPHPAIVHLKITRILEKMNVRVEDNEY